MGDGASEAVRGAACGLIDATCRRPSVTSVRIIAQQTSRDYTALPGSFGAWGAPDVSVEHGHHLPELVARFLVREAGWCGPLTAGDVPEFLEVGDDEVVVYMLDGPAGLGAHAPLADIPSARERHTWCQRVLSGDFVPWPANMTGLTRDGIVQPEPWWTLQDVSPVGARLVHVDDEHGVGRYVAVWEGIG